MSNLSKLARELDMTPPTTPIRPPTSDSASLPQMSFWSLDDAGHAAFTVMLQKGKADLANIRHYEKSGMMRRHLLPFKLAQNREDDLYEQLVDADGALDATALAIAVVGHLTDPATCDSLHRDRLAMVAVMERLERFARQTGVFSRTRLIRYYRAKKSAAPDETLRNYRDFLLRVSARTPTVSGRAKGIMEHLVKEKSVTDLVRLAGSLVNTVEPCEICGDDGFVQWLGRYGTDNRLADAAALVQSILRQQITSAKLIVAAQDRLKRASIHVFGELPKFKLENQRNAFLTWFNYSAVAQVLEPICRTYGAAFAIPGLPKPRAYMSSPWPWQFILAPYTSDVATLADGICTLILTPRGLGDWGARDRAARGLVHVLRRLRDLVTGAIRSTAEFKQISDVARAHGPDIVPLFTQFLAFSFSRQKGALAVDEIEALLPSGSVALEAIFENARCAMSPARLLTSDEVDFQRLLDEEAEQSRADAAAIEQWVRENSLVADAEPEIPHEAVPPHAPKLCFRYVTNFGSPRMKSVEFLSDTDSLAGDLRGFFEANGVEPLIPVSSIASALVHFACEMTEDQRRALQSEPIAGVRWRKIKRGAQRIYLLERDGCIFLHLMKRKDWMHGNDLASRYNAAA